MILLPAIDIRDGRAVRLVQGDFAQETVYDDDPLSVAIRFVSTGADWLHVVDLDAALTGQARNRSVVASVIEAVAVPVQASGGIRDADAVVMALASGARRVVLGTGALHDPGFAESMAKQHGDAIAVGLDVRGDRLQARGWTEDAGELWETLERLTDAGVQRFVVTDVARDGMLQGPNMALLQGVIARTDAAIVASGGVSSVEDLRRLDAIGCDAAIIGKALYAGAFTLEDALEAMR